MCYWLFWTIFNTLFVNAVANEKNISLLVVNPGPRLAPFYDLLSTEIYSDLSKRSAMKIGGENRIDWLQMRHWERFADSVALKSRYVLSMVRKMASRIVSEAEALAQVFEEDTGGRKTVGKIMGLIKKKSERWV
jgi:serine/threonine-protein kinase HipA